MANADQLVWDEERVGLKDGCVLFMAKDGDIDIAGAVDAMLLEDLVPKTESYDAIAAFRTVQPALRRAVEGAYRMGVYEDVWDAPSVLRHRRVLVKIGKI